MICYWKISPENNRIQSFTAITLRQTQEMLSAAGLHPDPLAKRKGKEGRGKRQGETKEMGWEGAIGGEGRGGVRERGGE